MYALGGRRNPRERYIPRLPGNHTRGASCGPRTIVFAQGVSAMMQRIRGGVFLALLAGLCVGSTVRGDEGMWLFNAPPSKVLAQKYGFKVTRDWLEHVQKSS